MSLYGEYDNFYCVNPSPYQLGGKNRADTARRDAYGRFCPAVGELPEPREHGRAGGLKRAQTAKRNRGKFTKETRN